MTYTQRSSFNHTSLKGVFAKKHGEKLALLIATNLTSICCVYKRRKLLKTTNTEECNVRIQIQKVTTFNSDRKKSIFQDLRVTFENVYHVSWIFYNKDDIFIFSRNVRKSSASEILSKKKQNLYEILTVYECIEN